MTDSWLAAATSMLSGGAEADFTSGVEDIQDKRVNVLRLHIEELTRQGAAQKAELRATRVDKVLNKYAGIYRVPSKSSLRSGSSAMLAKRASGGAGRAPAAAPERQSGAGEPVEIAMSGVQVSSPGEQPSTATRLQAAPEREGGELAAC